MTGKIRVGIGGWTFEPWRDGVFFPEKWPQARELEYAASKMTAIEVNGTYYSGFQPKTFRKWHDETPDGFVFTLKASRFCTNRKVLAEAGESVGKFCNQGISELGPKLGAILWQFMATKKFDAVDMAAFIALLPEAVDGVKLRHAIEVRHDSFNHPDFVRLCRDANVAIVFADSGKYPALADVTADFMYARLRGRQGRGRDRLHRRRTRPMGQGGEKLGRRPPARRPDLCRPRLAHARQTRRCVRLHDQRGQGARPPRRHGADRTGGAALALPLRSSCGGGYQRREGGFS
jgi:uncharacterized protein YecE (DUF72 family)